MLLYGFQEIRPAKAWPILIHGGVELNQRRRETGIWCKHHFACLTVRSALCAPRLNWPAALQQTVVAAPRARGADQPGRCDPVCAICSGASSSATINAGAVSMIAVTRRRQRPGHFASRLNE